MVATALGLTSVEVRPDGVYVIEGPIEWTEEQTSLVLSYRTVGDDASTGDGEKVPRPDKPPLTLTEAAQTSPFQRRVGTYTPPSGFVFVTAGGRLGHLQMDGIQIGIEAASEAAVVAAAQSLIPMR